MSTPDKPLTPIPRRGIGVHTLLFLIVGYTTTVVDGALKASVFPHPTMDLLVRGIAALNLGLWAVADSQRRGRPIPLLSRDWFVLFGWLLVPAYAIRSRGLPGAGWVLLHGFGWLVVFTAAFEVAATMAYGRLW